jgi:RNA polymerase sigma-70 factor (ECF subfamily)
MTQPRNATDELLMRAAQGDGEAVNQLLARHRDQLRRMVACHLDTRLASRVDPSDVVQEAFVIAAKSLVEYAQARPMPFYPWLRRLASQRLIDLQRRHLDAKRRSVHREEPLARINDSTVHELARHLLAHVAGPRTAILQSERRQQVQQALESLDETQRELLLMVYVEDLSLAEAATVLQITAEAARMRHFRALKRLREVLDDHSGNT